MKVDTGCKVWPVWFEEFRRAFVEGNGADAIEDEIERFQFLELRCYRGFSIVEYLLRRVQ